MNANNQLPYDIAVVGLGINGTHQITREVEETIRRCQQTFVIDTAIGIIDYLKAWCPEVTDLMPIYSLGTHRRLIYRRMASEVVAAAVEKPPVCFATYGHPKMYCHPTTLIQRAAKMLDLKVAVLPGISSLDTLLVDVNVDPGFDGLQLYDATDLVVRRRPLQTDVSCVVLQAPMVLEPYSRQSAASIENLMLLQNYLLEFYPPDHKVTVVICKTHPLLETIAQHVPVGELASALQQASNVGTLFIPPTHHREIAEQKLADKMKVPAAETARNDEGALPRRGGRPTIGPQST